MENHGSRNKSPKTLNLFWVTTECGNDESKAEDQMYECKCCKSLHDRKDHPAKAGMCPECFESRSEELRLLYDGVERVLSHALQPELGFRERTDQITQARDNLRRTMRSMGWQGQF